MIDTNVAYNINLNCVVFSTNITLNQRLILSINKNEIVLPCLSLNNAILSDGIQDSLIKFLKQYVFVSDLELLPQLISMHSSIIESENNNTINAVYGFLIKHTESINNAFWLQFEILKEQKYSPLLFEVIQKLR